jgi:hypothetical protein
VAEGTLIPIICCSAKTGVGLAELLDALVQCALPPTAVARRAMKDGAEIEIKADPTGPLIAQVFKTRIDPFVQKLSFIRMYSGTMKKDETVPTTSARKGMKLGPLLEVQGSETKPIDSASAGDILAIAKIATMVGLLGTVTGMMGSFGMLGGAELSAPAQITGGIAEALIATAFGLTIAISCLIPMSYLHGKANGARHELEDVSTHLEILMKPILDAEAAQREERVLDFLAERAKAQTTTAAAGA